MAINILEFLAGAHARGLVENMPERQFKKFLKLPQKDLEMILGKVYELVKDEIKKQFIKIAIEEIKKRGESNA